METERRYIIIVSRLIVRTFDTLAAATDWVERNRISDYEILPVRLPKGEY